MESASPEHQPEQPPGYFANAIGVLIATMTITVPLYAISNFNMADSQSTQQPSSLFMRVQE
ncbi:MAG: hypothetical protein AAFR58_08230 [Cyanobacteria bacterium J06627_28]